MLGFGGGLSDIAARSRGDAAVGYGFLRSPLALTRSQAAVSATAIGTDGTTLNFYDADIARFQGGARRLLIEGQRANLFLNSATGVTQSITVTAVAHTLSFYGTGTITLTGASTAGPLVGTGASNRVTLTFTPTAASLTLTVSGTCTRVQLEVGAFASSYAEAGGTAFTRGADLVTASLSSLAVPATGACTVLVSAMIPSNAVGSGAQTLTILDDTTNNNRFILRNASGSTNVIIQRVKSGVSSGDTVIGTLSLGTLFRAGIAIQADGRIAGSVNGGAVASIAADALSGLTTFRVGADRNGITNMYGEIGSLRVLPYVATDADLPALVSAIP